MNVPEMSQPRKSMSSCVIASSFYKLNTYGRQQTDIVPLELLPFCHPEPFPVDGDLIAHHCDTDSGTVLSRFHEYRCYCHSHFYIIKIFLLAENGSSCTSRTHPRNSRSHGRTQARSNSNSSKNLLSRHNHCSFLPPYILVFLDSVYLFCNLLLNYFSNLFHFDNAKI